MTSTDKAAADVAFLRGVIRSSERSQSASVSLLWAGIVLAGSVLADVRPEIVSRFWLIASPVGFLASGILAFRSQVLVGQLNAESGRRELLHWATLMGGIGLLVPLVWVGILNHRELGSLALLLVGLSYVAAGLHLRRSLLIVGLTALVAYLVTLLPVPYRWTTAGSLISLALVQQAFARR